MQRVASLRAQNNLQRWSLLLKKAEQAGHISLRAALDGNSIKGRVV